jgi:acyl-CoA synthetase (AMP-forming)/AMP-acid ligase II
VVTAPEADLLGGRDGDVALRGERAVTYGELRDRGGRLAEEVGRRLVFFCPRGGIDDAIALVGLLRSQAAVALFPPPADAASLRHLVATYRPALVFGADAGPGYSPGSIDGLAMARGADGPPLHPDLRLLLSTSGSTGSPKLVRLSAASVLANARSIAAALSIGPDDRAAANLPFHYSYGLSVLTSHLVAGAGVVLTHGSPVEAGFWDQLRAEGVTALAGVPYGWEMMLRLGIERMDLPSLRVLTQAGGALSAKLVERLCRWSSASGRRLYVMYGQTEATARIAVLPPSAMPERIGSVGWAIPGGTLSIADPGPDGAGEVIYRGPNVMMGYAVGPDDLARGDDLGGVLATGDLGRLDDGGALWITGRSKRIAKVYGNRLNLDEVEAAVPGSCAAVGAPDRVVIWCEGGDEAGFDDLRRSLAERFGLHHRAFELRRIDALPKTSSGKLDYGALLGRP